jgi:hypothetical protein
VIAFFVLTHAPLMAAGFLAIILAMTALNGEHK